jgi:LruC domain-containing protein
MRLFLYKIWLQTIKQYYSMMKKTIQFVPIIAIAMAGTVSSCVDSGKDLYDPSYETPNPMGDGFAAPDGFDWSMMTTKNVSVEVKDEEGGLYTYLVEIYADDPLANESASALTTMTADKGNNFKVTAAISLLSTQKGIYIKQIDPRGREQIYQFDVPENSDNMTCKLYYVESATQSRALMSRSVATRGISFEKPDYSTIPDGAKEITEMSGTTLLRDASYKITSDYIGTFKFDGYNGEIATKVYVDAKWTIPSNFEFQNGIEIIVMDDAKIQASGTMTFIRNSMLTIMDQGSVATENISFTNGEPAALRNWGTLAVTNNATLHSGAALYNKGTITSKDISINSNTQIVNDNKIELEGELNLPSNFSLENNGELYGKKIIANSDAVITNTNIMVFETMSFTNTTVNNSCSMEATTSFYENGATFNFNQGYLKAPKMEFMNGTVNLNDGSMLDATTSIDLKTGHVIFYGKGENASMIKSPVITGQGFTYDGNLAIESDNHVEKNPWWDNFYIQNGAYITKTGESKTVIEVCTGTKNNGNEGEEPKDPDYPIIVDDTRNYAYLFEDQWPLYGDYDMNDVVLIIKERKISINKDNKAQEFKLSIDLSAAGATKSIGAAIMLDGVPASAITQPVEFSDNSLIQNFNVNNNRIENGQDYAVIPLFDDAHKTLGLNRYEQINTIKNSSNNKSPKNISFTIKFSNPISVDELNINKLNVFIFVEGNRNNRKEIHVAGYQPTKLANTDLFGGNNDDSSTSRKRYYISKENLAWGIMVPTEFQWPLEYTNIKNAYSLFESWVTSGGSKNQDWWKTFDSSKVYK